MGPLLIALAMLSPPGKQAVAQPPSGAGARPPEMMVVDGSKNPELIPQWNVWGYVFRVIAGGSRQLPSSVYQLVSRDEEALVLKEADAVQKIDAACQERASKAVERLGQDTTAAVDARIRTISVECRRGTLRARDRVLAALNPAAATALVVFAESTKAGTSISVPKKDLARFLEPE
jgi:hypothetical protein